MFERLKGLFANGKLSEAGLNKAVAKGWITEEEVITIMGGSDSESDLEADSNG